MNEIRIYGDPVIRESSAEVATIDQKIKKLSARMAMIMRDAAGVGLAAPQIGILKRLIVVDLSQEEGHVAYVNPRILEYSKTTEVGEEGCLCVPGLYVPVKRSTEIVFEASDLAGRVVRMRASDILARVLQHEVDHLSGTTIMERTDAAHRREAMDKLIEGGERGY